MSILNASNARNNFFKIMDEAIQPHEPVYVTGKNGNVVMLSEEDYKSMLETMYLCSVPGMRERIMKGLKTPLSDCVEAPDE